MVDDLAFRYISQLFQTGIVAAFCVNIRSNTHIDQGKHTFFERFPVDTLILFRTHETIHTFMKREENTFHRKRDTAEILPGLNLDISHQIAGRFQFIRIFSSGIVLK